MASIPLDDPCFIGRYEVKRELGRGSMGVVVLARDPLADQLVAIKVLEPAPGASLPEVEEMKARFLNEARAAGRLSHPHIVKVIVASEDAETGQAFMVMEYVDGVELTELIQAGLDPERVVSIISDVASALEHAHERGVIHRDIKPANVLVDTNGRAKLADFGVARLVGSDMTRVGQVLGSPAYMAPEQVRGRPVGPTTDVFSLAVMAYEALTLKRPFGGDNLLGAMHAVLHEQHVPPSTLVPSLGPAVDALFERALAKRPEDRPASPTELAKELEKAVLGRASARPAPAISTATVSLPGRSNVALGAAIVLAALAFVAVGWVLGDGSSAEAAPPPAPVAVEPPAPVVEPAPKPKPKPASKPKAAPRRSKPTSTARKSGPTAQRQHSSPASQPTAQPKAPVRQPELP